MSDQRTRTIGSGAEAFTVAENETHPVRQAANSTVLGALAEAVADRDGFEEKDVRAFLDQMDPGIAWDTFGGPAVDIIENAMIEEYGDPYEEKDETRVCGVTGKAEHDKGCKYLGGDAWNCGKLDS